MENCSKKTERLVMQLVAFFQLLTFYVLPQFAGPADAMGMVFLMILLTFLLSAVFGAVSGGNVIFLYPIATAILFVPSVYIYYNESAWIHSLWYFVVSFVGTGTGAFIGRFIK